VSLLPDRSSRILGLAAAQVLGLAARPWEAGRERTVVVAYRLDDVEPDLLGRLRPRAPGQVLVEHATRWTDPPPVAADFTTLLHQVVVAPWGERMRVTEDGAPGTVPPDERPAEALAAEIVAADPDLDEGDAESPPDPDARFTAFAAAVRGAWAAPEGFRDRAWSPGPVRSNRFG
jgi:hypothetical protein